MNAKVIASLGVFLVIASVGTYLYFHTGKFQEDKPIAIEDFKTYTNTKFNYSIKYPKEWKLNEKVNESGFSVGFDSTYSGVRIIMLVVPYRQQLYDVMLRDAKEELQYSIGELILTDGETATIVQSQGKGSDKQYLSVVLVKSGMHYEFIAIASTDFYAKNSEALMAMARSLAVYE